MVPGVCRLSDMSTGHGGFPPKPSTGHSPNVRANSRYVHRLNDSWATHCNKSCHGSVASGCSRTVRVNGRGIVRIGDAISCSDAVATGSSNVRAGG